MCVFSDVDESPVNTRYDAGTTDAIFLDKPSLYDLIIDMTTSRPARPAFFVSRLAPASPRGPRHRLHPVRFTFSDVRLWSEIERTLRADSEEAGGVGEHKTRWSDGWRMYEDVCVVCAGAWMGGWRGASNTAWSIANASAGNSHLKDSVRLTGEDDGIRNVGRGIEGRPVMKADSRLSSSGGGALSRQVRTTLALLNIFHAHSQFLSERLSELLDEAGADADSPTLVLTPRDVMALELGVLSDLDARFLEWLAERNEKSAGKKVVVRRGWKDLLGVLLGFS